MSEPEKVWVRVVRYHSYLNILREPDTYYQVAPEHLETVMAQQIVVRENPPIKAVRPFPPVPSAHSEQATAAAVAPVPEPDPIRRTVSPVMTTTDMPVRKPRR